MDMRPVWATMGADMTEVIVGYIALATAIFGFVMGVAVGMGMERRRKR